MPYKDPSHHYAYRARHARRERVSREMMGLCTMCGKDDAAMVYRRGRQTLKEPYRGKLCEPCRENRRQLSIKQREAKND